MSGGGSSEDLQVSAEAREHRLARRVAALERQVETRIAQVEDLQRRLAHAENGWRAAEEARGASERRAADADGARGKAVEYDALMGTFTMRALRVPRTWYAQARQSASRIASR